MNSRYLIINADDYGMCESVNTAINHLFGIGGISSSTILAPAAHAGQACLLAQQNQQPVGVHFTLHSEWQAPLWPACGGTAVPSLTGSQGMLLFDAKQMAKQAKGRHVTRELQAQHQFLVQNGCSPTHADSHGGTLYGTNGRLFFINAFRVCRRLGLPFRFAKTNGFLQRQFGGNVPALLKAAHKTVVGLAVVMGVNLLDNFVTNPYPVAKIESYTALQQYYETQLASAPAGITEVFMHPATPDAPMLHRTPEWQKRVWEYQYLQSGDLQAFAQKHGFTVVSWRIFNRL